MICSFFGEAGVKRDNAYFENAVRSPYRAIGLTMGFSHSIET